jgi:hypothetical protein
MLTAIIAALLRKNPDPDCTKCYGSGKYRVGSDWRDCPCTK